MISHTLEFYPTLHAYRSLTTNPPKPENLSSSLSASASCPHNKPEATIYYFLLLQMVSLPSIQPHDPAPQKEHNLVSSRPWNSVPRTSEKIDPWRFQTRSCSVSPGALGLLRLPWLWSDEDHPLLCSFFLPSSLLSFSSSLLSPSFFSSLFPSVPFPTCSLPIFSLYGFSLLSFLTIFCFFLSFSLFWTQRVS